MLKRKGCSPMNPRRRDRQKLLAHRRRLFIVEGAELMIFSPPNSEALHRSLLTYRARPAPSKESSSLEM